MVRTNIRWTPEGEILSTELPLWALVPLSIEWQIQQRDNSIGNKEGYRLSINAGIVVNLASLIDSLHNDIYAQFQFEESSIKYIYEVPESINEGIIKFEKAFRDTQNKMLSELFNKPLNSIVGAETNEAISVLIKVRNKLTHGVGMRFLSRQDPKDHNSFDHSILQDDYKDVWNYLLKKKLCAPPDNQTSNQHFQMFSDEVIQFFFKEVEIYFCKLVAELPNSLQKQFPNPFKRE